MSLFMLCFINCSKISRSLKQQGFGKLAVRTLYKTSSFWQLKLSLLKCLKCYSNCNFIRCNKFNQICLHSRWSSSWFPTSIDWWNWSLWEWRSFIIFFQFCKNLLMVSSKYFSNCMVYFLVPLQIMLVHFCQKHRKHFFLASHGFPISLL